MRVGIVILLGLVGGAVAAEGGADQRYGIAADLATYPQGTARQALASALEAIDAGKFDYLVAQLADPSFVDDRVKRVYGGRFEEQVQDTRERLDPSTVKLLRRFLEDGKWDVDEKTATARLEGVGDRVVRLRQKGGRWYLEHRSTPAKR